MKHINTKIKTLISSDLFLCRYTGGISVHNLFWYFKICDTHTHTHERYLFRFSSVREEWKKPLIWMSKNGHFQVTRVRAISSPFPLFLNLSSQRNLKHYTTEESLWCRALHTIFTYYRGKTLNFLKIFWRPRSTFHRACCIKNLRWGRRGGIYSSGH